VALATLALAVPSWLLTAASFTPLEHRASLNGSDVTWSFPLVAPEWLFLESDLTVRTADGTRPTVVVSLNDREVARLQPTSLFVGERRRTLIPMGDTRAGANQLRVRVADATANFAMNLRVQNYHGINPRFPRAVVVADEAAASRRMARGVSGQVLDLMLHVGVWLVVVWVVDRLATRLTGGGATPALLPGIVVLGAGVIYSVVTPYHLWLSGESLVTLTAVPALAVFAATGARRSGRRIARAVVLILIGVGLAEIGLRAIHRLVPTPIFYTESSGRYRGRPGAPFLDTHLNARGFNDRERALTKPAGVRRIVAIGDSMVFGVVPRQHNYLTRLERELATPDRVEVINLGVPGTGPDDYLALLADEALAFAPDLVLVNFYVGNDFETRRRRPYEHSFVATLIHAFWRVATSGAPTTTTFESSGGSYDDESPTFSWERFLEIQVSRAGIYVDHEALDAAAAAAVANLAEMRRLAGRAGTGLLVVILPDEVQVDGVLQDHVIRAHGAPRERFDFARPTEVLIAALTRRGIDLVDLTPVFRDAARDRRLYKPQDTHWNIAGNQLAATALARQLRDRIR
jgi:lysophospholipase L1-like esterase